MEENIAHLEEDVVITPTMTLADDIFIIPNDSCTRAYITSNSLRRQMKPFFIDKNMRIAVPSRYKGDAHEGCLLVPDYLFRYIRDTEVTSYQNRKFLVVDKKKFFESQARDFVVKYSGIQNEKKVLNIQNYYINFFNTVKETSEEMKELIGSYYDEDHYDLLFYYDETERSFNFVIIVKHEDVIVKNSIEQSHYIGTLFTYLFGIKKDKDTFLLSPYLCGTRPTYSFSEIASDYVHSHLPKDSSRNFNGFCLGHDDSIFMGMRYDSMGEDDYGRYKASSIQLEGLLLAVENFIRWESLEGGPHKKMETISVFGDAVRQNSVFDRSKRLDPDISSAQRRNRLIHFLLQPEHLEELKSEFILMKKENHFRFTFNPKSFTEKIVKMINEDQEFRIRMNEYSYDSLTGTVAMVGNGETDNLHEEVQKRKERLIPSYINGKIIPAEIISSEEEQNLLRNTLFSLHPMEYLRFGDAIVRLLNKEIQKNEYRKEQSDSKKS